MAVLKEPGGAATEADHFFWQSGDLARALQQINQSNPATLATNFEHLTAPATSSDANGKPMALFRTLSVSEQLCVILSVRARPSKFPKDAASTLQQLVADEKDETEEGEEAPYLSIVRTLVGSERPPSCPEFLYTKSPAFPWAPELCTLEEANARKKNAASQHAATLQKAAVIKTQAMKKDGSNYNGSEDTEDGARLIEAQARIRAELLNPTTITSTATSLSPSCIAALDNVLNAAAAIRDNQQQQQRDSNNNTRNNTDPLEGAGLRNILPDDIILHIVAATISFSSSFLRCTTVAGSILLPAVAALDAPPTQSLTAAARHLGRSNPKALIEHCWIPLIMMTPAGGRGEEEELNEDLSLSFNKYHAEFILRSIKQDAVPSELLYLLVDVAVQIEVQFWNDHVIAILQTVLDTRPAVVLPTTPTVTSLLAALLHAGQNSNFKGSIKLAKVLFTFVKGHGKQLIRTEESVEQCRRAVQLIGTFMMKSTLSALDNAEKASRIHP
ncbi:hypothetical protein Ndes2526B_g05424 [Nannochloris sp. 'desiccata']